MPVTLNGKYQLGRTLGSGTSCKVKIARDGHGNRFAIKVMHRHDDTTDFVDTEFEALSRLSHRNIIRLVEADRGY
jgi:serine/threonine protein kinase